MPRLNIERQNRLEPKRIAHAKKAIEAKGYQVSVLGEELKFQFNGNTISFYPYSGWVSGKGVADGRGLKKLLDQI